MVDATNHHRGVLIDLDIAARIKVDRGQPLRPILPHAGTLEFRAYAVLSEGTHYPTRLAYRDELESFYYVLLYIQLHYRDGRRLPIHEQTRWGIIHHGDIGGLSERKLGSLNRPIPECPLRDWLLGLQKLFYEGLIEQRHRYHEAGKRRKLDDETRGGVLTYHNFMKTCSL